jgi:hypothetical protein
MKGVTNKKQKNSLRKTRALLRLKLFIRLDLILRVEFFLRLELNFGARVFMIGLNSARLKTPSSVSSPSLIKLSRVYSIKAHLQEIVRCRFKLKLDLHVIPSLSNRNVLTVTA